MLEVTGIIYESEGDAKQIGSPKVWNLGSLESLSPRELIEKRNIIDSYVAENTLRGDNNQILNYEIKHSNDAITIELFCHEKGEKTDLNKKSYAKTQASNPLQMPCRQIDNAAPLA